MNTSRIAVACYHHGYSYDLNRYRWQWFSIHSSRAINPINALMGWYKNYPEIQSAQIFGLTYDDFAV